MNKSKESIKSFYKAANSLTEYLPEKDKYLAKEENKKWRFNIIGAGNIGREHINVTMMESRSIVNGIYDINEKVAKDTKEYFKQKFPANSLTVYKTLEEACEDPNVDGLIICTPNHTHIDIVNAGVKGKKHILLEKPMATNMEDAYKIMEIANRYDKILQIGLQYRYKSIYVEAIHEALERKNIGNVKTISIMEHRIPFLDKVGQWNKFSQYSGGTLVEKCCHYFDLFNVFAQSKPVEVYATGSAAVNFTDFEYDGKQSDIVDNAFVNVLYENGIRASFNLCMFSPMFYEELVLCGDEGRLKAYESERFDNLSSERNYLEVIRVDGAPSKTMTPGYAKEIEESGHGGSSYYEQIQFIDSIEGNNAGAVTVEEGFWSIVIGVAAEESLKKRRAIKIEQLLQEDNIDIPY